MQVDGGRSPRPARSRCRRRTRRPPSPPCRTVDCDRRSANPLPSSASVPSRITANSSPPMRAATSLDAEERAQPATHGAQHLVAGRMTEAVVDRLEPVEVHQHQREAPAVAHAARHRADEQVVEGTPVEQSRQRIVLTRRGREPRGGTRPRTGWTATRRPRAAGSPDRCRDRARRSPRTPRPTRRAPAAARRGTPGGPRAGCRSPAARRRGPARRTRLLERVIDEADAGRGVGQLRRELGDELVRRPVRPRSHSVTEQVPVYQRGRLPRRSRRLASSAGHPRGSGRPTA